METDLAASSIDSPPHYQVSSEPSEFAMVGTKTIPKVISPPPPDWATGVIRDFRTRASQASISIESSSSSQQSVMQLVNIAYQQYQELMAGGLLIDLQEFCRLFPEQIGSMLFRQIMLFFVDAESDSLCDNHLSDLHSESKTLSASPRVNGFTIKEELGRGSFATVYKATEDEIGQRTVVIKIGKFGSREADTLGRLCHDNIVPIYSVTTNSDGISVMCMPYLGRETLSNKLPELRHLSYSNLLPDILKQSPPDSTTTAKHSRRFIIPEVVWVSHDALLRGLKYATEIAAALVYAHAERVLHLDLKPSNVMVTDKDQALLLDFNLAHNALRTAQPSGGTITYMSPEQINKVILKKDSVVLDHRSDIYSLGVLLFEMFYAKLPFNTFGPNQNLFQTGQVLRKQQAELALKPRNKCDDVPDKLARLISRCLAFDRDDRPDSMQDAWRILSSEQKRVRWKSKIKAKRIIRSLCGLVFAGTLGALLTWQSIKPTPIATVNFVHGFVGATAKEYSRDEVMENVAATVEQQGVQATILRLLVQLDQQDNPHLLEALGNLYHRMNWVAEAEKWYEQVLQVDEENLDLRINLALCYIANGRVGQADKVLNQTNFNSAEPSLEHLYVKLECYLWFAKSLPVNRQQGSDIVKKIEARIQEQATGQTIKRTVDQLESDDDRLRVVSDAVARFHGATTELRQQRTNISVLYVDVIGTPE
ncbi:MAG: protein kinase [Pirellulaceae bacterium]